jgi:hypothetical protein
MYRILFANNINVIEYPQNFHISLGKRKQVERKLSMRSGFKYNCDAQINLLFGIKAVDRTWSLYEKARSVSDPALRPKKEWTEE